MKTLNDLLKHTIDNKGCLEWQRCVNSDGYARCAWQGNSNGKVHRIVYSLVNPEEDITGKVIRHTCDNPICINPDHLVSGQPVDNNLDRDVRGRSGTTKLLPKQVKAIRDLWATGNYYQYELGMMFNVNHRTISYVVKNLTHKHVM